MSRKLIRTFLLFSTVNAASFLTAENTTTPPTPLDVLSWMTTGTWTATATPPNAKPVKVASVVRWSPNKHAIQFTTTFNGVAHYDGIYAWNPQTKSINFWYTSAEGELTTGTAQADDKGLEQEFDIIDAAGNKKHLRSQIRRDGPDAYNWNVEALKDGTWTELIHLRYTRE